jgi:hypothetical protein
LNPDENGPLLEGLEIASSFEGSFEANGFLCPSGIKPGFSSPFQGRGSEGDQTKGCSKMLEVKDLAMDDREYLIEQKFGNSWGPRFLSGMKGC